MDKIAKLSGNERSELFQETAARKNMTPTIVEKDFWVCWVLGKIFSTPSISKKVMFKGGTSLSKVFGLIERFSEDIDLILDWNEITNEDPMVERSKTKQATFNKEMIANSQSYLKKNLLPELEKVLAPICKISVDNEDANSLNITYPVAFSSDYLRPEIKLEIGPLAIWVPNDKYEISSYAAQEFPALFKNPTCTVRAIRAERTFWEKATILHHEAHRLPDNPQPSRYSRHYYDLAMMAKADVKGLALADLKLLESVVESKIRFYPRSWANYELAKPGTLKLVPPDHLMISLKRDYGAMKDMIFGDYPTFDEIINLLSLLEKEINK